MQGRLAPQAHKHRPTQPTPELASQGLEAHLCFASIASRPKLSCPRSTSPSSSAAGPSDLCPSTPGQTPCTCPQAPYNTRTFPGGVSTHRPEGDKHRFFGKIPVRPGPYSSGMATATFLSSSGCRRQCQSFTGNLHYVEQKWFRTP